MYESDTEKEDLLSELKYFCQLEQVNAAICFHFRSS